MTLSGSNILVFLSLCRETWDTYERARVDGDQDQLISPEVQSQAIRVVAEEWLGKQLEFPGGADRKRFLVRLGTGIRRALLKDHGLVYPGHNGFSILQEEYEGQGGEEIRQFLSNAVDFGALVSTPHTNKERDKKPRRKWYLFPILAANFDIPAVREKEPYYARLLEVGAWIKTEKSITLKRTLHAKRRGSRGQKSFFDNLEEEP